MNIMIIQFFYIYLQYQLRTYIDLSSHFIFQMEIIPNLAAIRRYRAFYLLLTFKSVSVILLPVILSLRIKCKEMQYL